MPVGTIHGARELCAGELPDRADLPAEKIFLISDFRFKIWEISIPICFADVLKSTTTRRAQWVAWEWVKRIQI